MKFKYLGKNKVDEFGDEHPVSTYGGLKVLSGESIELDGFLAEKAMKNPNYEMVKPRGRAAAKPQEEFND